MNLFENPLALGTKFAQGHRRIDSSSEGNKGGLENRFLMSPFIKTLIQDKRYISPGQEYRRIDSTSEVNEGGLENRLQYEHIVRVLSDSYRQFLNDYLPDGKKTQNEYVCDSRSGRREVCDVYLWAGYVICVSVSSPKIPAPTPFAGRNFSTGSDYFGQWVNIEEGVYGDNLLELYIYHSKSHPRDAHKTLACEYEWDLSPDAIFLRNHKFGYRQSLTVSPEFNFFQPLKFAAELGWRHRVFEYRNGTGALRGVVVYWQSPDKKRIITIPVVQYERISDNGQQVVVPPPATIGPIWGWPEICYRKLKYQLSAFPPRPVFQADISFFEAPYPLYNEHCLEDKKDAIIVIADDEFNADNFNINVKNLYFKDNYLAISWPGGKNTVKNVCWRPLEGHNVGFLVYNGDINLCRLAYDAYKSVAKAMPVEFKFHVLNNNLPDSLKGSDSFSDRYRALRPDEFVKYVWEKFHIALEAGLQPALSALTVDEFVARDIGEPDYALAPVLPHPGTAEIFAPRGLGKTFFALELAKNIAAGGVAFERWASPVPRNVLYIDGEMSAPSMAKRIKLLNLEEAGDKLKIMSASTLGHPIKDLSTAEGQADVERYLKENKTEVIFIDNLATLAPRSLGNDAECCIPLNAWVQELKCRGYTVVLIHHAGKANGGRGGSQRGSSTKEDMLDLVISLQTPKQKRSQAHFNVALTKAREVYGEVIEGFSLMLTTSEDGESAHWETAEKANSDDIAPKPKPSKRSMKSSDESAALLAKIENLYRTTSDNEDIIAEKVGFKNRGCLNRFLDKFPDEKKRIKAIRPSARSAKKIAAPQVTIESEPISSCPH